MAVLAWARRGEEVDEQSVDLLSLVVIYPVRRVEQAPECDCIVAVQHLHRLHHALVLADHVTGAIGKGRRQPLNILEACLTQRRDTE